MVEFAFSVLMLSASFAIQCCGVAVVMVAIAYWKEGR